MKRNFGLYYGVRVNVVNKCGRINIKLGKERVLKSVLFLLLSLVMNF